MRITDKINFRQPKYMLPAIVYIPLIATGYFVFDMFNTEVAETQDKNLQTTEFLNPNLPGAQIKNGDGIGGKYENMAKSYGRIADYSAVDNIERDNEEEKEAYESKYTEEDLAELVRQAEEKDDTAEVADAKAREAEALEALNKALAEARLRGQSAVAPVAQDTTQAEQPKEQIEVKGQIAEDSKAVKALDEEDKAQEVVKKVKVTSDYFNTLTQNEHEPKLIKAIIDEDVKATDGSRVRLRLLDDIEIGETVVKKGSYLYATMSGFGSQRVKGSINSILVDDELIKVSLSLYDTDGLEGLYVPGSQFRETTKDVADDEATVIMVDSNIQREELLISEKAFAYKMKYEALKRQGKRSDLTSCQVGKKLAAEEVSQNTGDSSRQILRYIHLTELVAELLELADEKKLPFNTAVEVSYLRSE